MTEHQATDLRTATFAFPVTNEELHELRVWGKGAFQMKFWRDAINSYLAGVWGDKKEMMGRPSIAFGGVTLRLDPVLRCYNAYGVSPDEAVPALKRGKNERIVMDTQDEVEIALVRFVKDESLARITIHLHSRGVLVLFKKDKRGEYGAYATDIPVSSK